MKMVIFPINGKFELTQVNNSIRKITNTDKKKIFNLYFHELSSYCLQLFIDRIL